MDIAVADYFMLVLALLSCIVASVALSVRHGHRCRGLFLARLGRPAAESRHRARGHLSRSRSFFCRLHFLGRRRLVASSTPLESCENAD